MLDATIAEDGDDMALSEKQEKFLLLLIGGTLTREEAWVEAGYKPDRSRMGQVINSPEFDARYRDLLATQPTHLPVGRTNVFRTDREGQPLVLAQIKQMPPSELTVDDLMNLQLKIIDACIEDRDHKQANAGTMQLARMVGAIVDRKESKVEVTETPDSEKIAQVFRSFLEDQLVDITPPRE